jgi:hypothetical protein
MSVDTWSIHNNLENPSFVGGESIAEFDYHLSDPLFQPEGTPNPTPKPRSSCFNKGGLNLDPGTTHPDDYPDTDRVDLGMHYRSKVPPVDNLVLSELQKPYTLEWVQPTHYLDGRIFSDLIGNILYFSAYDPMSGRFKILSEKLIDPRTSCELGTIPENSTHAGIGTYNSKFAKSSIEWVELE